MKKPYCCEASKHLFAQYYDRQQKGEGNFPIYVGRARQRGHGIGDIFKSIWSFLFPAIKSLAPVALRAGANIVDDVTSGNTWKDSALKHGPSVLRQIPSALSAGVAGRNAQSGSGKRRRKRYPSAKKRRRDIFS